MNRQDYPEKFKIAEENAESILRILDISKPPVNLNLVYKLYKNLLVPKLENFPDDLYGYTYPTLDEKWQIVINEKIPYPLQRGIFMHELNHVQNKEPMVDSRSYKQAGTHRLIERAADKFSEAILLPKDMFIESWEKFKDEKKLAEIFLVPQSYIKNRRLTLGIYTKTS